MNFQDVRTIARRCAHAFMFLAVTYTCSRGQEQEWPSPAKPPEWLAGIVGTRDAFDHVYRPMSSASVYVAKRGPSSAIYGRLNAASRFDRTGVQAELEAYPLFGTGDYAYLAYAVSGSPLFPRHRIGAEAFFTLPRAVEASGGMRMYLFSTGQTVVLATGSGALYAGNLWFSVRPYLSVNSSSPSLSMTVTGRFYFREAEEFVFVRASSGFTPDERTIQSAEGLPGTLVFYLRSRSAGFGAQSMVGSDLLLQAGVDVTAQELSFRPGSYVTDVTVTIGGRWRF